MTIPEHNGSQRSAVSSPAIQRHDGPLPGIPSAAFPSDRREPSRAALQNFNIGDVAPGGRLEAFRHFCASLGNLSSIDFHRHAPEHFHAEATVLHGRQATLMRYSTAAYRSVLTRDGVARCDSPRVWLVGYTSGSGVLAARGRARPFGAFSISALVTAEPFAVTTSESCTAVAIAIPAEMLSLAAGDLRRHAFTVVPALRTHHTLLLPIVRAFLDPCGPAIDRDGLDLCLAGVADMIIRTADGLEPDHMETHEARRIQIEHYIRDHLNDPGLCAHTVATELRISVRLVHKLFQGRPETFHDLIQRQRVEHAERLLAARPGLSLDRIAVSAGFGSTKTLVRAFRRVNDETPSQHRRSPVIAASGTDEVGSATITPAAMRPECAGEPRLLGPDTHNGRSWSLR